MRIQGRLTRPEAGENHYGVEIPALSIFTQGKDIPDAYFMAKDAVLELLAADANAAETAPTIGKRDLKIEPEDDGRFTLVLPETIEVLTFVFRRLRQVSGLSLSELAQALGVTKNAVAQVEQGRITPSLAKLKSQLEAMGFDLVLTVLKRT